MTRACPMRAYELRADCNHYQMVLPPDEADWDVLHEFDGRSLSDDWRPVHVEVFRDGGSNRDLPHGNFPLLASHIPVFDARALEVLEDLLVGHGEFLPLECSSNRYYALNITCLANALDEEHSVIRRFDDGSIMHIPEPALYGERIQDLTIFKLQQRPKGRPFVTQPFVDRVEETGLKGFLFKPVRVT